MTFALLLVAVLLSLAGCAGRALPYEPAQQPPGAHLSAAYHVVGERLRIEIASGKRAVEEAVIVKPDGSELRAVTLELLPSDGGYPGSVGVGVGGGRWGGNVGVGTGVSVGVPVGGGGGPRHTLASFPLDQAGSAPWRLRVKVAGLDPVLIVVGGPAGQ
jgi:hypothetical protein